MTPAPLLDGILAIEVSSHVRGRYCGRLFAELGATVVRFETPGPAHDTDRPWLDPGKSSAALDWRSPTGEALLAGLCATADVLIEDLPARDSADRFGGPFRAAHPRLVHVSLTPFGLDGPWAEHDAGDLAVSALSGMAMINRVDDGSPMREPGPQTEIVAALSGFVGALAALEERGRSGRGQLVEVSSLEAMVNVLSPQILQQSYQPGVNARRDADYLFPCADGWMSLIVLADPAWDATVSVLELPIDPTDERFATQAGRRANFAEIREMIIPRLARYSRRELFDMLSAMRVVCGMVMAPSDLLADPHLEARKAFVAVEGTDHRIPRVPIRARGGPLPDSIPLPTPGEHTADWLARTATRIADAKTPPMPGTPQAGQAPDPLPLQHLLVADLTQAWAGTYATQLLADLGATVIKIESRRRLDPWRGAFKADRGIPGYPLDGPGERPYNRNFLHNSVNRNKLGITLDLGTPEGKALFLALVRRADIVAENFTPRVLPNFGLAYDRLRDENPRVILLSMPAYGLDGPYSHYPGIGGTMEPMSGNTALLGEPGGRPHNSGVMYPDAVAGLHGAAAVLAALRHRATSGEGCHMEVAQHETTMALTAPFYVHQGWEAPFGNRDFHIEPHGMEHRHDGTWVARSGEQTAPARTIDEVLACEHLAARGYFLDVDQPEVGVQRMAGITPRLSRTPGRVRMPAPRHGEHSRRVLRDVLNLDDTEIDRLVAEGITGSGPPPGYE